jgi:hypothetical protein
MAFFGILLLTIARRDPKLPWHLAAASFHLFSTCGIIIFWQGAVAWNVASAEAAVGILNAVIAAAHLLLYALARKFAREID